MKFEVHVGSEGPLLVTFVSPVDVGQIKDPIRDRTEFQLFNFDQGGMVAVAIPISQFAHISTRALGLYKGYVLDAKLKENRDIDKIAT